MSESQFLRVALIGALLFSPVAVPAALAQEGAEAIEEVLLADYASTQSLLRQTLFRTSTP